MNQENHASSSQSDALFARTDSELLVAQSRMRSTQFMSCCLQAKALIKNEFVEQRYMARQISCPPVPGLHPEFRAAGDHRHATQRRNCLAPPALLAL